MTLERTTKETWDKLFNKTVESVEDNIHSLSEQYIKLLQLKAQYRVDYKTNRINHFVDTDRGVITYKLGAKKVLGFKQNKDNKDSKDYKPK